MPVSLPRHFLLFAILLAKPALSQTLKTASEVARHPSTSQDSQPRVEMEALVTFIDPNGTVFLRDSTGTTFLRGRKGNIYQPGQTLRISGTRFPGLFIGGIVPEKVDIVSMGPLPEPRPVVFKDLATGSFHYEFVEIEGVGRSFEATGETTATLKLNIEGGTLEVRFDQAPPNPEAFIDASLRIRGLAAGAINNYRQLVRPYLRASDSTAVTIVEPAPRDPFETTPLSGFSDLNTPSTHRIKISGVALGPLLNGNAFIRLGERSVRVLVNQPVALSPGDLIEALGFPEIGPYSAILTDAIVRVSPEENLPAVPLVPDGKQLATGAPDADLVTIDALVIQQLEGENTLIAEADNQAFRILSPAGPLPEIAAGSRARFTGIWLVTEAKHSDYRAVPVAQELWLRSPADATILSAPSWWTPEKLTVALAAAAAIGLLAIAWAAVLKRQVSRQLEVIAAKVQREAMMEERQRIAREFHDTLEQELAGLSIRLDAATPRVADVKAKTILDQLRHLLLRLQTETRDFIWDLRDQADAALADSLQNLVNHLQTTTAIPIAFTAEETPPISALAKHHLLRIAREAVHNAIKYSGATTIQVHLLPDRLIMEDNGIGFDASKSPAGHFGLQGMKERVRKINATLDIESRPGQGTRIQVILATPVAK